MVNLVTDKAVFGISLRNACLGIAIFFLCSLVIGVLIRPSYLYHSTTLIGFILEIVGNLALLFGVLWVRTTRSTISVSVSFMANQWLVLVWLINALLFYIHWPIAVLGVIFNYGNYRYNAFFTNIFLILLEYIIVLVVFGYCTYLVYSFFHQLRNSQTSTPHNVVV